VVIDKLLDGPYMHQRKRQAVIRTVIDLILLDRLYALEDGGRLEYLQISAEVPMMARGRRDLKGRTQLVKGRADWVLAWGEDKVDTGNVLVVVEAKKRGLVQSAQPQLLAYMAAVQKERRRQAKTNTSVFGMVSDGSAFIFAFLDERSRFFLSLPLMWWAQKSEIIGHLDDILKSSIESSPHTTPVKEGNRALKQYYNYVLEPWNFGVNEATYQEHAVFSEEEIRVNVVKDEYGDVKLEYAAKIARQQE
jgi:hypothetical protein